MSRASAGAALQSRRVLRDPTGTMLEKCFYATDSQHHYVRAGQTHLRPSPARRGAPMHTAETRGNSDLWEWINHSRISFHRWVMQMGRKASSCSQMLFHSNDSCMANTLRPENVLIFKRHNYLIIGICILQRFGEVTKKWVKYKALCSLLQGRLPGDTGQLQMATQAPNTGLRQGNTSWWDKSPSLLGQLKIKQVIHLKL